MKIQQITLGIVSLLAVFGSGCTVKCRFEKIVPDYSKVGYHKSFCSGFIKGCGLGANEARGCRNTLEIECDGAQVYRGPFKVSIKNNIIKYTASDWSGSDAPFIKTRFPEQEHDVVRAKVVDGDYSSEGSCKYNIDI